MPSRRALVLCLLAVGALLPLAGDAQAPPHIQTAHTFLMAWGNQRWDDLRAVAAEQVTVRLGDQVFTLAPASQKSEVSLVFPFRGLSTVRVDEKVKGITVDELGLKVGDREMRGPGTITLNEQGGEFRVIGVSAGAAQPGEKSPR